VSVFFMAYAHQDNIRTVQARQRRHEGKQNIGKMGSKTLPCRRQRQPASLHFSCAILHESCIHTRTYTHAHTHAIASATLIYFLSFVFRCKLYPDMQPSGESEPGLWGPPESAE